MGILYQCFVCAVSGLFYIIFKIKSKNAITIPSGNQTQKTWKLILSNITCCTTTEKCRQYTPCRGYQRENFCMGALTTQSYSKSRWLKYDIHTQILQEWHSKIIIHSEVSYKKTGRETKHKDKYHTIHGQRWTTWTTSLGLP